MKCTCNVHFLYAKRVAHVPSTSPRQHNAVKGGSLRAYVSKAATALSRRRLVHCTNDRKSEGVCSMKLYNTLRTRQFPHMHNAVSSLIACEDTIMCRGGNGLARSVLHVSKVTQRQTTQDKTQEKRSTQDKRQGTRHKTQMTRLRRRV